MRIAVIGATGLVGRYAVEAVTTAGHDAVPVARSLGHDLMSGSGLDSALAGVDSVIDVLNIASTDVATVRDFFATSTRNLLAAEARAGARHHVVLSIVGLDRIAGNAHYEGKRVQEELVSANDAVPWTVLRATQFHEFAEMVVGWTRDDGSAIVPPLLVQPVAARDVADTLVAITVGPPQGRVLDLAGPEPQDLVDMARRALAARGESLRLIPSWRGPFSVETAGEILLPDPDAQLAPTTFDEWLERVERLDLVGGRAVSRELMGNV